MSRFQLLRAGRSAVWGWGAICVTEEFSFSRPVRITEGRAGAIRRSSDLEDCAGMGLLGRMFRGEDATQGVPGEALLDHFSYIEGASDGSSRGARINQTLQVRPYRSDGTLGAQQKLRVWIRAELGKSLGNLPDARIPVRVDPATGAALTIDEPRLNERLAGRTAEAEEALKGSFTDDITYYTESIKNTPAAAKEILSLPKAWLGAIRELRGPTPMSDGGIPPGDPLLEPIEGVTFDVWIAVCAAVIRLNVPPAARDELAQKWGVPPGRWEAINSVWEHRKSTDWRMVERAGTHQEAIREAPERGAQPL